jgi:hypothetical protein
MGNISEMITTIALAIVGVAVVAVIVSRNSQSPAVIQSAGSAFGNSLAVAEAPVTGANATPNLSYPGGSSTLFGGLSGFGSGSPFGTNLFG